MNIAQSFETSDVLKMAGKTVTLSFYARAGANYSAASSALTYALTWGTGVDQSIFGPSAIAGGGDIARTAVTLTTSWQRFVITFVVPSTATSFGFVFYSGPVGTAGAADYYELTNVQLEEGAAATDFRRNAPSIQGELAACQRYYWRTTAETNYQHFSFGMFTGTTTAHFGFKLPVSMRTPPSSTLEWTGNLSNYGFYGPASASTLGMDAVGRDYTVVYLSGSGWPAGTASRLFSNNNTTAYFGFSAEL
jgi:hypothetical protein